MKATLKCILYREELLKSAKRDTNSTFVAFKICCNYCFNLPTMFLSIPIDSPHETTGDDHGASDIFEESSMLYFKAIRRWCICFQERNVL